MDESKNEMTNPVEEIDDMYDETDGELEELGDDEGLGAGLGALLGAVLGVGVIGTIMTEKVWRKHKAMSAIRKHEKELEDIEKKVNKLGGDWRVGFIDGYGYVPVHAGDPNEVKDKVEEGTTEK